MEIKFYKNKNTGNIIFSEDVLESENFTLLKENTADAAFEKHVPVYEVKDDKIEVKVGEVPHPMTEEHYIMWIMQVSERNINIIKLNPGEKAVVTFDYIKDSEIYAYCNLHGLWKTKVK